MTIYETLLTKLKTAISGPIAETGKVFPQQPANTTWARATDLRAENQLVALGTNGYEKRVGIFQIDLFRPIGTGTDDARAEQVKAVFDYKQAPLTVGAFKLRITRSWIANSRELDGRLMTTVMVRWEMPEK